MMNIRAGWIVLCLSVSLVSSCGGDAAAPAVPAVRLANVQGAPAPARAPAEYVHLVQMIYVGYFGRPADPVGLTYYTQMYSAHGVPATISEFNQSYYSNSVVRDTVNGFGTSKESADLYAGDNEAFITAVYDNLFARAPDDGGKAYWVGLLNSRAITRGNAAITIMASSGAVDAASVDNKARVASAFTVRMQTPERIAAYKGMAPGAAARQMLRQVGPASDPAAFSAVLDALAATLLSLPPAPALPGAPQMVGAVAGDGYLLLQFTPPAADGGSAILSYMAQCETGGFVATAVSATSPIYIAGLPNGVPQSCSVSAKNGGGIGPNAAPVALAPRADAVVWSAPSAVSASGLATSTAGRAYVTFAAPAAAGAAPSHYIASCAAAGDLKLGIATASPIVVEGLQSGASYACTVKASSAAGVSAASSPAVAAIPTPNPNRLRFLYLIPSDRQLNEVWAGAVQAAAAEMQQWFKSELNGPTFTVHAARPEVCYLPRDSAAYFSSNTWNMISQDLVAYCGVSLGRSDTDLIVYADVLHDVNTPGRLGAGALGLAMFPRQDLEGLGGAPCTVSDEGVRYCFARPRWTGGAAHEIGHSLGVPHPPGCDAGLATCDATAKGSIMWQGYATYPNAYLLPSEKAILQNSRFIR